jgi:tryptophan-rich sensory protein
MPRYASLAVFLVVVLGGGLLIGYATAPGAWYAALSKPAFNPPNWIFAPVWSLLYVLIAVAGWRIWRVAGSGAARTLWIVQLALNFLWSPVFFGARMPKAALAAILLLLATILGFVVAAWTRDRSAAWLFVPYAAWVAFAALLNLSVVWLN